MLALFALIAVLHLTAKDNSHLFTVKPQTAIVVTLASNASTGYHWKLAPQPTRGIVRLVSHKYVQPKGSPPGAEGKEIWRFRAIRAGSTRLTLLYVPPGRSTTPARRVHFAIRVR